MASLCFPAQWGGSCVRVERRWPLDGYPLTNGAGSFVRAEGRLPFGCAPLPDGAVDHRIGPSTSECTKVLHAIEPGSVFFFKFKSVY